MENVDASNDNKLYEGIFSVNGTYYPRKAIYIREDKL